MLNVYFDGTNSGIDPGVELVVEGVIVSINVAGWNVGILVVVSVGWIKKLRIEENRGYVVAYLSFLP